MAYGDTGVGRSGGFFKAPYPWTWGQLVGVDAAGKPKTANVQFLIDTGATDSAVASDTLSGFKVTFQGVVSRTTGAGPRSFSQYKGLTFKVQASQPAVADCTYNGPFLMSNPPEAKMASLVGTDLANGSGAIFTINSSTGTVVISK